MTFQAAQGYLLGLINENASRRMPNRLDRIRAFLAALGDPQDRYPTIHVAGTSGKGSTSTMIATILQASGKRTGLHTKPHLASVTERARIDGLPVPQERFGELVGELRDAGEAIAAEHGRPTYYEMLLALAFLWFAREPVDVAVIEAGIGGKLDGTNVLRPRVAVVTNVALDHTEILGDTVEEIARDKGGVAKPGVPLVTASRDPRALDELRRAAQNAGAPFHALVDEARVEARGGERYGQSFAVVTPEDRYDVSLPLLGEFQQYNAATAIRTLELSGDLRPSGDAVAAGLARTVIPGRMEYFPSHPGVVFDIAHNPDKAQNLAHALGETFPGRHFTFVIAIGETKDAIEVIRPFVELPSGFVFTSFAAAGRHAMRPQRLASIAEALGAWGKAIADPVEAFAVARRLATADDVVVVTGSTFLVAELREWWIANVAASSAPDVSNV
ncbi:MAG TPA: folylpolyglutamate synthase/dihydrofolate synthase family protein [Candidatus Baltobacteraceae bacterium]|nr:folylpolyglutamate synthase/dihydrofolate synthase family protein [Candidatus Baltobacteraceae bacterium]